MWASRTEREVTVRTMKRLARLAAASAALLLTAAAPAPVALKTTEFGSGPTIVLIHAVGSGRMSWMPTARKLLSGYHVVMMDLPGHGDSPMPDPFSYDAAAAAVDQVLAKQKAESTIVVGQGAGGMLALLALHAHPQRARGLVAIDSGLKFPIQIADQDKKQFLEYLDTHFDEFLKQMVTKQARDSAQGVILYAQVSLGPRANMITYMRLALDNDATGALKNFPLPILFIGSEKSWAAGETWPVVAKKLGWEEAAGVQTLRIGGSGAMIATDQPDSLSMAISAFAKRVLATKP